jgi:hypothetical protein
MATTTNYSWSTPDDTALVKDGAAAIRSLGTAIDTTVFTNAGAAINKTIVDAKGDLIVASGADAVARLAVGTNDHVLTADSGATNGVKWAVVPSGGMTLLSTTSLSGSSSVSISSISGDYKDLQILIQNPYQAAANGDLYVTFNSANLFNIKMFTTSVGETTQIRSETLLGTTSYPADRIFCINIKDYTNTTYGKPFIWWGNSDNTNTMISGAGVIRRAAAITEMTISDPSGLNTNFSGGQVQIYGVK